MIFFYLFFKALAGCGQAAWVIDADTLWIKHPPPPGDTGHFFATIRVRPKQGATKFIETRNNMVNFLRESGKREAIATPWCLPLGSPLIAEFIEYVEAGTGMHAAEPHPLTSYQAAMDFMASRMRRWGLRCALAPPDLCSPLDYFASTAFLRSFDQCLLDRIVADSACINALWSTSKRGGAVGGLATIRGSGSVWDHLLTMAMPLAPSRRRLLGKTSAAFLKDACVGTELTLSTGFAQNELGEKRRRLAVKTPTLQPTALLRTSSSTFKVPAIIGRSPSCDIVVDDKTVSHMHCAVTFCPARGHWYVKAALIKLEF